MHSIPINPQIHFSWLEVLQDEFQQPYFPEIKNYLQEEKEKGMVIYPPGHLIFNAFNLTSFNKVKVIIIGQDPYHGKGQAHGLSFSVPDRIKAPPSLVNILKELNTDLQIPFPTNGNLERWAQQGVLLLNAILTVRSSQPASHHDIGWEKFTDAVIGKLSEKKNNLVFLLWGKYAQEKGAWVDAHKHLILKAPHPSPYSASNGFFGCRHFSQANNYLQEKGLEKINW